MGFRFSRRIRILPGVRLNLSKSGVSTSIGGRGAWLTFGKRGTRATVGLPGTGLSYSTTVAGRQSKAPSAAAPPDPVSEAPPGNARRGYLWMVIILMIVVWAVFRALSR
jgi:Protein of unknown function (DUF4236)